MYHLLLSHNLRFRSSQIRICQSEMVVVADSIPLVFYLHLQIWHVFCLSISWHMQWFMFLINSLPLCFQVPTKIYIAEVYQVLLSVGEEIYIQFSLLYRLHCWPVTSFYFWREGEGCFQELASVNRKGRAWSDCIFYFQSLLILPGEGESESFD